MSQLPKHKRKEFSPKQKAEIFLIDNGQCRKCKIKVGKGEFQIDHINPDSSNGKAEISNGQTLCTACHKVKTKADVKAAAKGRRLRGETGQLARRKRNGSRLQSRGFDKSAPKQKIPSRPFPSMKSGLAAQSKP